MGDKPAEMKACNGGPCVPTTTWYSSPWSQVPAGCVCWVYWLFPFNRADLFPRLSTKCNVPCGNGTQRRDLICVQKAGSDFIVVQAGECAHLDKPPVVQQCEMGECKPQWFTTEWSAVRNRADGGGGRHLSHTLTRFSLPQCSQSCGRGVQMREVRCLTEVKRHSYDCRPDSKPEQEQGCNVAPCGPQPSGGRGR